MLRSESPQSFLQAITDGKQIQMTHGPPGMPAQGGEGSAAAAANVPDIFEGFYEVRAHGKLTPPIPPGRCVRKLRPLPNVAAPTDKTIISWAMTYPMKDQFVKDFSKQVSYRTDPKSGKPFAVLLKPLQGRGNVTVYPRTGMVCINGKAQMQEYLVKAIESWTVSSE